MSSPSEGGNSGTCYLVLTLDITKDTGTSSEGGNSGAFYLILSRYSVLRKILVEGTGIREKQACAEKIRKLYRWR